MAREAVAALPDTSTHQALQEVVRGVVVWQPRLPPQHAVRLLPRHSQLLCSLTAAVVHCSSGGEAASAHGDAA